MPSYRHLFFALALAPALARAVEAPVHLSETGLFSDAVHKTVAPENRPFEPQYPLWSDGAEKARWVFLPPGTKINTGNASGPTSPAKGNIDYWVFPVGTKFWKEFSFPKKDGHGLHRVETRFLEKTGFASWNYATYLWNEDETDATRAPAEGVKDYYPSAPGFTHDIPAAADCLTCHNRGGDPVLGFDVLQLSPDRDPRSPHARQILPGQITLETLVAENRVTYLPPTFAETPPRIVASSPEGRAVMGYLHANCGNCHNPTGPAGFTYLFFRYPNATSTEEGSPLFTSGVEKACYQFKIPGIDDCVRIRRGKPEESSIVYRMRDKITGPAHRMPPLGTKFPDAEAVALIEQWVRNLAP